MPAIGKPIVVGRNADLAFWSTTGLRRDVIDAGGLDGTVRQISDREAATSELQPGESITDYWESYVEARYDPQRRTTEVRFRGVPSIHSLNWERTRVEY